MNFLTNTRHETFTHATGSETFFYRGDTLVAALFWRVDHRASGYYATAGAEVVGGPRMDLTGPERSFGYHTVHEAREARTELRHKALKWLKQASA